MVDQKAFRIKVLGDEMERQPKFSAVCPHFGQASFVYLSCEKQGISAVKRGNEVSIFSKRKLPMLEDIMETSLQFLEKEAPEVINEVATIYNEQALIGVYIKKRDIVFVTERQIDKVVAYMFMKKIPRAKNFKVFNTTKEFKDHMEHEEKLII